MTSESLVIQAQTNCAAIGILRRSTARARAERYFFTNCCLFALLAAIRPPQQPHSHRLSEIHMINKSLLRYTCPIPRPTSAHQSRFWSIGELPVRDRTPSRCLAQMTARRRVLSHTQASPDQEVSGARPLARHGSPSLRQAPRRATMENGVSCCAGDATDPWDQPSP